jgi:hypothetical protein
MIKPLALGAQAGNNVAQTLAVCKLRKDHAKKLIQTGKGFDAAIATVSSHALAKFMNRKMIEQLREDGPSKIHAMPSMVAEHGGTVDEISNRLRPLSPLLVSKQEFASNRQKLTGH